MSKTRKTKASGTAIPDGKRPAWMNGMKEGAVRDDEEPVKQRVPNAGLLTQSVDTKLEEVARRLGLIALRGLHEWPRLMPLADVVAMQVMSAANDEVNAARRYALGTALAVDCDQGRLACVRRTVDAVWRDRATGKTETRPGTLHLLRADDLVLWLASRQEAASEYVLAWKSGSDRLAEPQTWRDVAVGRQAERKGKPWSNAEKRITQDEFQRRGGWKKGANGKWKRNSAIAQAMALDCGYSNGAARTALQRVLGNEPAVGAAAFKTMGNDLGKSRK